jgi:hypothetical protein
MRHQYPQKFHPYIALKGGGPALGQPPFLPLVLNPGVTGGSASTLDTQFQLLATAIEAIIEEDSQYSVLRQRKQPDVYGG